ncbi:hypothetical protein D3C76_962760 [compost metagenome]
MHAQCPAFFTLHVQGLGDFRPEQTGRATLGDFGEKVAADAEKETDSFTKTLQVQPAFLHLLGIGPGVDQGQCQLQHRIRTGLLKVIAGHRNRVEARHVFVQVADHVRGNAH